MLSRLKKFSRCIDGSAMMEYSALIAVLLVIGYFVYHGVNQNARRIMADSGERIDASWKRTVWPGTMTGTRPDTTVIRRADRIDIKYKDIEKRISPAAGPK